MTSSWFDYPLSVHQFHLIDVDFSFRAPPWVLWPSAGFSAIGMPEVTLEVEEIMEGTSLFPYKVIKRGNVNSISLSRGVSPFRSDFWRWTMACLKGTPPESNLASLGKFVAGTLTMQTPTIPGKRRNMMLLHLAPYGAKGLFEEIGAGKPASVQSAMNKLMASALGAVGGAVEYLSKGLDLMTGGLIDIGVTSIPAKAYMLFDCLPVRYRPGSDFDANSSDISIEELEISFTRFEEFALLG